MRLIPAVTALSTDGVFFFPEVSMSISSDSLSVGTHSISNSLVQRFDRGDINMGDSPSDNFTDIAGWIRHNPHPQAFSAKHTRLQPTLDRTLFPLLLGYREQNLATPVDVEDERVLCWQVANLPDIDEGYRCFKVIELAINGAVNERWPNPPPKYYKNPNHPRQGCVQDIKCPP